MGATSIQELKEARRPEEVFGNLSGTKEEQLAAVKEIYRRLARDVHPDAVDAEDLADANEAMASLNQMFEIAIEAIEDETYGTARAPVVNPVLIATRRRGYKVGRLVKRGDVCGIYEATYTDDDDREVEALVKVARDPRDNDLVQNEGNILKRLLSNTDTFDELSPYLPEYLEAFGYRPKGKGKARQGVAFRFTPGMHTLAEVREVYPDGVHPKHMAWMCRRILYTLGHVHENGVVHGALTPQHVLIHPEQHGIVLLDWKYAVEKGQKIRAIPKSHRPFYPPEVIAKEPALFGTDIFMAMRLMAFVMGGNLHGHLPESVPKRIRLFLNGSAFKNVKKRPQDAHGLLAEFDELIESMWGPRRFRPFTMNPNQ
jgi:serine/threonine protein kinase